MVERRVAPGAKDRCPFCAGNEHQTLTTLDQICEHDGRWCVRVVPNKFPAVSCEAVAREQNDSLALLAPPEPAWGAHEIIIESPRHIHDVWELSLDELARVLHMYRDRLRHWSADERIQHASVFKNVGYAAGASLEHIHSQLVALPFVPAAVAEELQAAKAFYDRVGTCVFCQLLKAELGGRQRWVMEEGPFAAFCAYAGRQPFETWILPTSHDSHFQQLSDDETLPLARILQQLIRRLRTQLKPLSYNLILHTMPFGERETGHYHWHLEVIPRSTQLAGLEWGASLNINPLSPERAAQLLRETSL